MKRYISVILTLIMVFSLTSCGMSEQDKQCIKDVQTGLQERWNFTNKEYKSYEEYQDNIAKGIDAELQSVSRYKDAEFENEKFGSVVKKYISALECQQKGIPFLFSDAEKYNELYIEKGLHIRNECLNQLKDKYDLTVDEKYKDNFKSALKGDYTPLVAPNKQVKFDTPYGEVGLKLIGFEILTNPSGEKEMALYCEIENFSYYDEWNGESILFDYIMGVYDGEQYNIEFKSSAHDYIDEYEECIGFADVRKGEKGKFAILLEYSKDIDIINVTFGGEEKTYQCYLTSANWKANHSVSDGNNDNTQIDYSVVREQMSNFSCEGSYNIYDGWVYSLNFPEDGGKGLLSKMRTDGTEYTVLTDKGSPYYIYIDGEYIYSIIGRDNNTNIYRCRLGGNDLKKLVESDTWYLQVTDDYLYYTKHDVPSGITSGFYRANKDGTNETLVIDKEIYYSYVIGSNLYYQDDNDNETIHKYSMSTKVDEKITNGKSYGFVIDGEYGYYIKNDKSTADGDLIGSLVKINLATKEEKVLYDGVSTQGIVVGKNSIYFINTNDEYRIYNIGKDGKGVKLISQDTNCTNLAIFGEKIMYIDCSDDNQYVDAIYLCDSDGSNKVQISKNNS